MKTNQVREKLRAGQPSLGCFVGLGSPNAAELLAHAGFEWLVIETEHSALDSAEIEHMLMAVNGTEAVPIVRVPSADPVYIQRALDFGALGIMVPMVRTVEEALEVVRATATHRQEREATIHSGLLITRLTARTTFIVPMTTFL